MRFQHKLLLNYSLLIVLLVLILSILFYRYSSAVFENNARGTYELLCFKLSQQLDNVIRPMDFISTNLISDASFKSALASLGTLDRGDTDNSFYTTEAMQTIRRQLSSYSIYKNFYAVVVFNEKGDFFSSNFLDHKAASVSRDTIRSLPWLSRAREAAGHSVVVSPYDDSWRSEGRARVFGRARVIPGLNDELGYIEVQNRFENLEPVLAVPDMEFVRILILYPDGEPFYASGSLTPGLIDYYRSESRRKNRQAAFLPNPLTKDSEFIAAAASDYSGLSVILVLNRRVLLSPIRFVRAIGFGIGLLIILFSVMYTWFSSRQLTKPLKLIQARMDETQLFNLPLGAPIDHPNDEIVALDRTFRNLTARLDESIRHELDSRTLWMQARLDSLQAQVNPHFINNILTVIANRGLESGDLRIGDICQGVASMLRYSTSTQDRSATLEQELEHVKTYLFLMKERLEDRLLYRIEAEASVLAARMPKIILQQIVENSINHGYRKSHKPISIDISARASEGRWLVEMKDDGEGFDPDTLETLDERIRNVGQSLRAGTETRGLGIGGLGLINTYSRLFLYYKGDITWRIGNNEEGGARVLIGAPIVHLEEEVGDAADTARRG